MKFYLGTPGSVAQAQVVVDAKMPVLVSFGAASNWIYRNYIYAFTNGLLIDSGAYSEMTGAKKVDIGAYREHVARFHGIAEACAGLDDIRGDWRRSLKNYEEVPGTFPTFHDSDPPELLDELVDMARERGSWIGLGLTPPRTGKLAWVSETVGRIPDDIHVHGWALGIYRRVAGIDSIDSTNWFRDAMKLTTIRDLDHLTPVETLRIVVSRYDRESTKPFVCESLPLFADALRDGGEG